MELKVLIDIWNQFSPLQNTIDSETPNLPDEGSLQGKVSSGQSSTRNVTMNINLAILILILFNHAQCLNVTRQSYLDFQSVCNVKVISMNIWAFKWPQASGRNTRVDAIVEFLASQDYDLVFLQEVWQQSDFQKLKTLFPFSSYYGTLNSRFCPQVRY